MPESHDEAVAAILSSALPELPDTMITLLASKMDAVQISQAFHSYTKAKSSSDIKDPVAYFLQILTRIQAEPAESDQPDLATKSTVNKLTDDSWAIGVTDEWDWLAKRE